MIYIAGKFTSQARLRTERDRLRRMGFTVSSGWLEETATDYNASPEYKLECAHRDMDEVARATTFVLDTIDPSETGGREVEFGVALGNCDQVFIVGPRRNVFHYFIPDERVFESWDGLVAHLEEFS